MKIKNFWQFEPSLGEINDGTIVTIPGQSADIRTILQRQANGIPHNNTRTPLFDKEDELFNGIDPKKLDIVELKQISKSFIEAGKQAQQRLNDKELEKKRKKQQEEWERYVQNEVNKRLQEKDNHNAQKS